MDIDAIDPATPGHPAVRGTRSVPEGGAWVRLVRPKANANTDFLGGDLVLLDRPGRVELVDRFPNGDALALYRTARGRSGSEAPDGALVWIAAQAFSRFHAPGRGEEGHG